MHPVVGIQTALLAFAVLFTSLRLYSRVFLAGKPGIDDVFSLLALALFLSITIIHYIALANGATDTIIAEMPEDSVTLARKCSWIMALIFMVASWAIKVSFCLTLYKVVHRTVYTASVVIVAVVTTVVTCFECLWTVFFCKPVQAFWLSRDPASCKNPTAWLISMYVHGITIMCADMALGIVVPILLLRRMHLQLALRISVALTLAVGSLASAATIIRMAYNGDILDPTRNFLVSNLALWMSIEVGVSIICTSAVALKPLLKKARIIQGSNRPADPATSMLGPNDQRIEYDVDFSLTWSDSQQQGIALEARASNRERELSVETATRMGKATMEYL